MERVKPSGTTDTAFLFVRLSTSSDMTFALLASRAISLGLLCCLGKGRNSILLPIAVSCIHLSPDSFHQFSTKRARRPPTGDSTCLQTSFMSNWIFKLLNTSSGSCSTRFKTSWVGFCWGNGVCGRRVCRSVSGVLECFGWSCSPCLKLLCGVYRKKLLRCLPPYLARGPPQKTCHLFCSTVLDDVGVLSLVMETAL